MDDWRRFAPASFVARLGVRAIRSETTCATRKADARHASAHQCDAHTSPDSCAAHSQTHATTYTAPDAQTDAARSYHAAPHTHAASNNCSYTASNTHAAPDDCAYNDAATNAGANSCSDAHAATNANRRPQSETKAHNETLRQKLRDEASRSNGGGHAA